MGTQFEDEPPLDPVLENVRRRLVRRMAWSLGIMMVGLMAVLGAIVYKISTPDDDTRVIALREPKTIDIELEAGERVVQSQLDSGLVMLEIVAVSGDRSLRIIDLATGQVNTRINFESTSGD